MSEIGDHLASDAGGSRPLKAQTIQKALNTLAKIGRAVADGSPGLAFKWRATGGDAGLRSSSIDVLL